MLYLFEDFELDGRTFELRRGGVPVPIQRQALEALLYLVRHHDRVVSKEELLAAAWNGTVVSEGSLNQAIWVARKALGDDSQRMIKTVRGKGFRFASKIDRVVSSTPEKRTEVRALRRSHRFVGRVAEQAELCARLDAARAGNGSTLVVLGEPGIGKTSLAEQAALAASADGYLVAWGRCWEGGGGPAFWPWAELLRGCLDATTASESVFLKSPSGQILAHVFPELRDRLGATARPAMVHGAQGRIRVFEALAGFFADFASRRPLFLVLEDVHAADDPSLLLLEFLERELASERVLVLGTARDTESHTSKALSELLANSLASRTLRLSGLDTREVSDLVNELGAATLGAPGVVDAIQKATAGNPFLVEEITRSLMIEGGAPTPARVASAFHVPDRAAEAVHRGLLPLAETTRRVLSMASVLGREVELALLCQLTDASSSAVLEALAPAVNAGLLCARGVTRFVFAHALVQETLYTDLSPSERADLHGRVADAIESTQAALTQDSLAQLAHHSFLGAPSRYAERAVRYAREAARDACQRLAYEESVLHLRRALEVLALGGATESLRLSVLLELGEALRCAGQLTSAMETFERAAVLARHFDDAEALALAADGHAASQQNIVDPVVIERLEEALTKVHGDTALRARLLGRLARALTFDADWQRPEDLGREAVDVARRVGDVGTLALVLYARRWSTRFLPAEDALALSSDAVDTAVAAGDLATASEARIWKACDLIHLGRMEDARAEIAEQDRAARALRMPWHRMVSVRWQAFFAILEGRFEEADAFVDEALAQATAIGDQNGPMIYWIHQTYLKRERGRFEDVEPFTRATIQLLPWNPAWRCVLGMILADVGRHDEARRELDIVAKDDFAGIPRDLNYLTALANASEISAMVGDVERARVLYRLLLPHGSRIVVVPGPSGSTGPLTRFLGILAASLGDHAGAFAHFDDALARCDAIGSPLWKAHVEYHYAKALLARNMEGDRDRARSFLEGALSKARSIGLTALAHRIRSLEGAPSSWS